MEGYHTNTNITRVAILGPLGTYTHEAAHKLFETYVEYVEQETITDVFNVLSPTIHLGVVPHENSVFGNVIETYDSLRRSDIGFVRGEVTLQVQHCLLVRHGVKLGEIEKIMSHEQALGQCQEFIAANLPSASVVKTTSTAAAARALLDNPPNCAAICSKICAILFDGLSVLQEGIQNNSTTNLTRFYIISKDDSVKLPRCLLQTQPCKALVHISTRIPPSTLEDGNIVTTNITELFSALQMKIIRVDRRPSIETLPFHDIYFAELHREKCDNHVVADESWSLEVKRAVERVKVAGGKAGVMGIW